MRSGIDVACPRQERFGLCGLTTRREKGNLTSITLDEWY